jgi:ornithine carbamoyltransferase
MNIINPLDLKPEDIWQIFELTDSILLKEEVREEYKPLKGKIVALVFELPSCRTRTAFEVAVYNLGGNCIYLGPTELGIGKRESIEDIGRVLSSYTDCIVARLTSQEAIERLAKSASVPVINGLSEVFHPCQIISDIYTIYKFKKKIVGINLVYLGDGKNNIANTWLILAPLMGMNITIASPPEFTPDENILTESYNIASKMNSLVEVTNSPEFAVKSADILYTDSWVSMGKEKEREYRISKLRDYQLNTQLLSKAKADVLVMHCLPAQRGYEITDEVIDGKNSIVFEQAKNRLHTQKAILVYLLS